MRSRASGSWPFQAKHRWWPEPLPDGRHVLFTIWYAGAGLSESQIGVLDLETGQHRALFAGALARYAAGHLVFSRSGAYHAVRFDPATLTMTGEPRVVLADAIDLNPAGSSSKPFGLSASGTMAFKTGEFNVEYAVSWLNRDGRSEVTPLKIRNIGAALSRDGTRLAYGKPQSGLSQIAIYYFVSNTEQRLQAPGYNFDPIWHPDGRRIAFTSMRKGDFDIYIERTGSTAAEPLIVSDGDESITDWPPVGEYFIARVWEPDGSHSVVRVDAMFKARTALVTGSFDKGWMAASEDGRWLALCARPADYWQLYVRSTSASGSLQPVGICRADNQAVFWLQASRELLFARGTEVVALNYTAAGDAFSVGSERVIARIAADDKVFGVSPDGQRLLIGKRTRAAADSAGIRVAVNGIQSLSSP